VLARCVQDAALFALGAHGATFEADAASLRAPRLGVVRSTQWQHAKPETVSAIERFIARASAAGATVRELALPDAYERLIPDQGRLVAYEGRQALAHERLAHPGLLSQRLVTRIRDGGGFDLPQFLETQRRVAECRHAARELFAGVDALIYPATEGEAEEGLENSGSPRFGALWTLLHLPTVALPVAEGPTGLPLGVQLVGAFGDDVRLLGVADTASRWAERQARSA
jgi:amidase